jgi:hypothetical protein
VADSVIVVAPDAPAVVEVVTPPAAPLVVEVNAAIPGPPGPPGSGNDGGLLATHIADETPHPAYDDLPSLKLLFENGLV